MSRRRNSAAPTAPARTPPHAAVANAPRSPAGGSDSRQVWLAAAVLVLSTAAAYSDSLTGAFVFDDTVNIQYNDALIGGGPLWRAVVWREQSRTQFHSRPVAMATFVLNYSLGGLDTRGYHATNLAIHLLAGLVLLGIVRQTLLLPGSRWTRSATPLALGVALVWCLHPLQTQAVTYIVQRFESLMGLFYLLTLYAAIRSARSGHRRVWASASVLSCVLALGCKEVAVSAPVVVLLYDRTFLAGSFRAAWRERWGLYAALGLVLLLFLLFYARFSGGAAGTSVHYAGFRLRTTPLEYARSQPGVILHYLRLCFWPQGQCADYAWPIARTTAAIVPQTVALGAVLAATLWCLARNTAAGFLGAWFFLILAPTSSIMPIADLAFEHRMYLPLAAVAAGTVLAGYSRLERQPPLRRSRGLALLTAGAAVAMIVALGCVTFLRNRVYASGLTLWQDTVTKAPLSMRAHYNLAMAYDAAGDYEQELAEMKKLSIDYAAAAGAEVLDDIDIQTERGLAYQKTGRIAEAQAEFREALAHVPADADPQLRARLHANVAATMLQLQNSQGAISHFHQAIQLAPEDAEARLNLAVLLTALGYPQAARQQLQLAVQAKPAIRAGRFEKNGRETDARPLLQFLARAWACQGDEVLNQPCNAGRAEYELGTALAAAGEHSAALAHFDAADRQHPDGALAAAVQAAREKSQAALRGR